MFTKTKIALVAALVVGSASVALADGEFDPNLGNRYPSYSGAVAAQMSQPQARQVLNWTCGRAVCHPAGVLPRARIAEDN